MKENRFTARPAATDFQAIMAELDRRLATQMSKYHLCPDRLCRRLRRCAGANMPCAGNPMPRPVSRNDGQYIKREIKQTRKRR
jgi:hypothetical protein